MMESLTKIVDESQFGFYKRDNAKVRPLDRRVLRLESRRLDAGSVGLRRSEIDGYFLKIRSGQWTDAFCDWNHGGWTPVRSAFVAISVPRDVARLCGV